MSKQQPLSTIFEVINLQKLDCYFEPGWSSGRRRRNLEPQVFSELSNYIQLGAKSTSHIKVNDTSIEFYVPIAGGSWEKKELKDEKIYKCYRYDPVPTEGIYYVYGLWFGDDYWYRFTMIEKDAIVFEATAIGVAEMIIRTGSEVLHRDARFPWCPIL